MTWLSPFCGERITQGKDIYVNSKAVPKDSAGWSGNWWEQAWHISQGRYGRGACKWSVAIDFSSA